MDRLDTYKTKLETRLTNWCWKNRRRLNKNELEDKWKLSLFDKNIDKSKISFAEYALNDLDTEKCEKIRKKCGKLWKKCWKHAEKCGKARNKCGKSAEKARTSAKKVMKKCGKSSEKYGKSAEKMWKNTEKVRNKFGKSAEHPTP